VALSWTCTTAMEVEPYGALAPYGWWSNAVEATAGLNRPVRRCELRFGAGTARANASRTVLLPTLCGDVCTTRGAPARTSPDTEYRSVFSMSARHSLGESPVDKRQVVPG